MGGPRGQGLQGGLGKCSEVSRFQGAIRGAGDRAAGHRAPAPHQLSQPVSHARGDGYVCPSCSRKAMPGLILSWPRHNLPRLASSTLVPLGLCAGGRVPVALSVRSLHGQAPLRGKVPGESLPVPNACLHEASTNRSPFFCCHLTPSFLPLERGGRFHKLRFLVKLFPIVFIRFCLLYSLHLKPPRLPPHRRLPSVAGVGTGLSPRRVTGVTGPHQPKG